MSPAVQKLLPFALVFAALMLANIALWSSVRGVKARWMNVPPAPSQITAGLAGLGDVQMAYRIYGIMIQNFGDTGGRTTALRDYDYAALAEWFRLEHALDPRSNYAPFVAAFAYGGSQDPSKIGPLIDYLELAAGDGQGKKWRWLAHAVHLARFKQKDYPKALALAYKLAAIDNPDMPGWTRQMPAFVTNESGDKAQALEMMLSLIESGVGTLQQAEINAMIGYVCQMILSPEEAARQKLCTQTP